MSGEALQRPFETGHRIAALQLVGWTYTGLSGRPDVPGSTRRYVKGMWVLELQALSDKNRPAKVLAIRTDLEDEQWWTDIRAGYTPKADR